MVRVPELQPNLMAKEGTMYCAICPQAKSGNSTNSAELVLVRSATENLRARSLARPDEPMVG